MLLPAGADQFDNARALADSGAGLAITPAQASPQRVREAICELLDDPRPRNAARILATEIAAMPSSTTVAQTLENLAAAREPSPILNAKAI